MVLRKISFLQIIQIFYLLHTSIVSTQGDSIQEYLFLNQTILSNNFTNFMSWDFNFSIFTCQNSAIILHQDFGSDEFMTFKLLESNFTVTFHGSNITNEYMVNDINPTFNPVTVQFHQMGQNKDITVGNKTINLSTETINLINSFRNETDSYFGGIQGQNESFPIGCISVQSASFLNRSDLLSLDECKILQQNHCDTEECKSFNCLNNGTCVINNGTLSCLCMDNYTGVKCELEYNPCNSQPCYNNATCVVVENDFVCHCLVGYNGSVCQVEINECFSQPCLNYGACIDLIGDYECDCNNTGYEGVNCEIDLNECLNVNQCSPYSNCTNLKGNYRCECHPGFAGNYCDVDIDECHSNPCKNNGNCVDLVASYRCDCNDTGYKGLNCEFDVNECLGTNKCSLYSNCTNLPGTYVCNCSSGYNGKYCEMEIDECQSNPCQNNGICVDEINGYTCHCIGDFTGLNCEREVDNCIGNQCDLISQACVSEPGRHYCICKLGFGGANCEELNECLSLPCLNGATCVDLVNNFTCSCAPGFKGVLCQEEINECRNGPCMNNAQCIDLIADYNCVCTLGWTGKNCSHEFTPCISQPCLNNGVCTTLLHTHERGYNCACLKGYTGLNCEVNIDDCLDIQCGFNEICVDGIASYVCDCNKGYQTDNQGNCTIEINECESNPCENKGSCIDLIGDFSCECVYGYNGKRCEKIIDFCKSNPCLNSAYCNGTLGGYKCFCADGYIGLHCEYLYDACVSSPCIYGRCTASDVMGVYKCDCYSGYTGINCGINIDECAPNPCLNSGTCTDLIADYNCTCVEGWSGDNCELNVNECASNPCVNKATCIDLVAGYRCECIAGYTGVSCEIDIDECLSQPCLHNGTCTDSIASYSCSCNNTGYEGVDCEIEVNECEIMSPCGNNATCIDLINDYQCICHEGYYGQDCEMDINECLSNPCQHNSTCLQKSNRTVYEYHLNKPFHYADAHGYICDCSPGYEGIVCETEINECKLHSPCLNNATCVDSLNDYLCQCSASYGGKNCSVDLKGCDNGHDCLNNGTCVPFLVDEISDLHSYTCDCVSGYTGHRCNKVTSALYSGHSYALYKTHHTGDSNSISFDFKTTVPYGFLMLVEMKTAELKVYLENGFISASYSHNNQTQFQIIEVFVCDAYWHELEIELDLNSIVLSIREKNLCETNDCVMTFNDTALVYNNNKGNYSLQFGISDISNHNNDGYIGCIRDITYNNHAYATYNTSSHNNIMEGCTHSNACEQQTCNEHGTCIDWWVDFRCECQRPYTGTECLNKSRPDTFSFGNTTSYAKFELPFTPLNLFDASMFLRTTQGSGILIYIGGENQASSIAVELNRGQLQVMFGNGLSFTRSNNLDDGTYHFISAVVYDNVLSLTVDDIRFSDIVLSNAINLTATELFVGGQQTSGKSRKRRSTETSQVNHFKGAMQDVQFNSYRLLFHPNASEETEVSMNVLGYLYPTQSSNILKGEVIDPLCDFNPCNNNGTCTLSYNDYVCNCTYGWKGKNCQDMDFCKQIKCPVDLECVDLSDTFECVGAVTINQSQIMWKHYGSNITSSYDQLRLQIKTRSKNADILFIESVASPIGSIRLYLNNKGLLVLVVTLNNYEVINKHDVKINDGKWHDIAVVSKSNSHIQIIVDEIAIDGLRTFQESVISTIFSSQNITISTAYNKQSIEGCLEDIRIGGHLLPFYNQSNLSNMPHDPISNPFVLLMLTPDMFKVGCHGNTMCNNDTCHNNGNCKDIFNDYQCNCNPGYRGKNCRIDINECAGVLCLNGGSCVDMVNNFTCECQSGYSGVICELELNECQSAPCQNNGICRNQINSYFCECNGNYTGLNCEVDISQSCRNTSSENFPCQNGGICTNSSYADKVLYNCICLESQDLIRYIGSKCENKINLCDQKICLNNSTCLYNKTLEAAYCKCTNDFTGEFCGNKILPCMSKPCQNNGSCTDISTEDFNCTCSKDFVGKACEYVNECNLPENEQFCLNNGSCKMNFNSGLTSSYSCQCNNNFMGIRCEHFNPCSNFTCYNGGLCKTTMRQLTTDPTSVISIQTRPKAKCNCLTGYEGIHCQAISNSYVGYSSVIILGSCIAGVIILLLATVGLFAAVSTALERRATSGTYSPSKQETVQVSFGLENRSKTKMNVERQLPPSERLI